ncbi:unnamed protein product [Peniophora sp. CBMAI 1063]|nr:unnamed protein product [Peniophora sp. CBMAI 1063]
MCPFLLALASRLIVACGYHPLSDSSMKLVLAEGIVDAPSPLTSSLSITACAVLVVYSVIMMRVVTIGQCDHG